MMRCILVEFSHLEMNFWQSRDIWSTSETVERILSKSSSELLDMLRTVTRCMGVGEIWHQGKK